MLTYQTKEMKLYAWAPKAIAEKVDKLLNASFIRETTYLEWISNIVIVKKAKGKWWICIDFIDLNRACPRDGYPLSRTEQMVDATSDHDLLSFMDTFSSYN